MANWETPKQPVGRFVPKGVARKLLFLLTDSLIKWCEHRSWGPTNEITQFKSQKGGREGGRFGRARLWLILACVSQHTSAKDQHFLCFYFPRSNIHGEILFAFITLERWHTNTRIRTGAHATMAYVHTVIIYTYRSDYSKYLHSNFPFRLFLCTTT